MATILKTDPSSSATQPATGYGLYARVINIALGIWVFLSAFVFNLVNAPRTNNIVVGIAIALVALWAIWNEGARYINTALSVWLVLSTVSVFKLTQGPLWSNLLCGVAVFVLSLVGVPAARTFGAPGAPRTGP
jgi:hypothetical protein